MHEEKERALFGCLDLLEKAKNEGYLFNQFILHGAEPLMLPVSTIAKIFESVILHAPHSLIGMQTNGTLLTDDCVSTLLEFKSKAHRNQFGVSIDGPPEIHNKTRGNTYSIVWKNITNAVNRGLNLNLLVGINSQTIEYLPLFEKWINDLIYKKIRFRFKFIHNSSGEETFSNYQMSKEQQVVFAQWLYKTGLMKYTGSFNPKICTQFGNNCFWSEFDPDGGVYSCNVNFSEEKKFADWKSTSFDEIFLRRKTLFRGSHTNADCLSCKYQSKCNSGCPSERSDGLAIDCTVRKTVYDLMYDDNEDVEKFWKEQENIYLTKPFV